MGLPSHQWGNVHTDTLLPKGLIIIWRMIMKNLPNFDGKVVSFGLPDSTLAILNPKFEKQAGRIFITGTIPEEHTRNDYALGNACAI